MCALSGQYLSQTSAELFLMTVLSVPRSVQKQAFHIFVYIISLSLSQHREIFPG